MGQEHTARPEHRIRWVWQLIIRLAKETSGENYKEKKSYENMCKHAEGFDVIHKGHRRMLVVADFTHVKEN